MPRVARIIFKQHFHLLIINEFRAARTFSVFQIKIFTFQSNDPLTNCQLQDLLHKRHLFVFLCVAFFQNKRTSDEENVSHFLLFSRFEIRNPYTNHRGKKHMLKCPFLDYPEYVINFSHVWNEIMNSNATY